MDGKLLGRCLFRVRYDECDSMGITYHARYLDWFVIGRTELLRACGLKYAELERSGLFLPVLEARCRYIASTRYDDWIRLETRLFELTRTRMRFRYQVYRLPEADASAPGGDGAETAAAKPDELLAHPGLLAAEGETSHAFVDAQHRPVDVKKRFPDVWEKLAPLAEALQGGVAARG